MIKAKPRVSAWEEQRGQDLPWLNRHNHSHYAVLTMRKLDDGSQPEATARISTESPRRIAGGAFRLFPCQAWAKPANVENS